MSDPNDLAARKAAAKARLQAASASRDSLESKHAEESEVASLERDAVDEEAIVDAQCKFGVDKIGVVKTSLGAIVLHRANAAVFRKFQDNEANKMIDLEKLVRSCLKYPDGPAFDQIIDQLPASLIEAGSVVAQLSGANLKIVSGKS